MLEFETLLRNDKNIFFVAFIQRKGHLRVSFLRWLGHSCFARRSASAKREAEWGSPSPLEAFVGERLGAPVFFTSVLFFREEQAPPLRMMWAYAQ